MTSQSENKSKTFNIRLNGKPVDKEVQLASLGNIQKLLLDAREIFGSKTPITTIYTENGDLVKRLDDIPDGATLIFSGGEQFYGKLFYFVENGHPKSQRINKPKYRSNGSLERLLTDATMILNLKQPAKIAYTENGERIKSLENIPDESTLVISTGNNFVKTLSSKERKQKLSDIISKAGSPNADSSSTSKSKSTPVSPNKNDGLDAQSMKSAMTAITTTHATKSRYARYHQLLAVLPGSVEDHIKDSMLATYISLPEEIKQGLENADAYENMLRSTQIHLFTEQLVHQMICPQRSSSPIDDQLNNWALKVLNELSIKEITFAITGPRYSGKTMMLYTLSSILYRKIIASDERDRYLMFPFNMSLHALNLDNPVQLYPSVVNIVFNSVRYARFDLLPFLLPLRQWFLSASTYGTMTKIPAELAVMPNIDAKAIVTLGKQFHSIFHNNNSNNSCSIDEFVNLIFSFPNSFAKAIGMKSALYVIDHIDVGSEDTLKALNNILQKQSVPFVVASQNDRLFAKSFKVKSTVQLYSENTVTSSSSSKSSSAVNDPREIYIPDLGIRFGVGALMGCPGFYASFAHLCELVEKNMRMEERASLKGTRYSQIVPKISIFRRGESDQEFKKFALALAMANSPIVTFDVLNNIDDDQPLSIKLVSHNTK